MVEDNGATGRESGRASWKLPREKYSELRATCSACETC